MSAMLHEALRDRHLPDLELFENLGSDYRWRALVLRSDWEHIAAALAVDIDYSNYLLVGAGPKLPRVVRANH